MRPGDPWNPIGRGQNHAPTHLANDSGGVGALQTALNVVGQAEHVRGVRIGQLRAKNTERSYSYEFEGYAE